MANELRHESTAAGTSCAQTDWEDTDIHRFDSQATGDILYASSATQLSRLAKGSDGEVLELAGGVPTWAAKGFSSRARAYRNTSDQVIPTGTVTKVAFDTESFDGGSEFKTRTVIGTADATEANKLHDADGGFEAADVGATVWNTTDNTYTTVSAFVDTGELTLADDIMVNGETYELYHARFTATVAGYYIVVGQILYKDMGANKQYNAKLYKNGAQIVDTSLTCSFIMYVTAQVSEIVYLNATDYLELWAYHGHGGNRDIVGASEDTSLAIHRLS